MSKIRLTAMLIIFVLILGLLAFFIGLRGYNNAIKTPNSDSTEKVEFTIEEGENVDNILNSLIENGLLREKYKLYAKIYLKINKLGEKIQAGTYSIPKDLNMEQLFTTLQDGRKQDIWITIPEGIRIDEIASIIDEEINNDTFSYDEFIQLANDSTFISQLGLPIDVYNLEGFLFPDKYAVPADITAQEAIQIMVQNFISKVNIPYDYKDIIIASIVEREGYNSQDRPIIAGIIKKRLEEGWLLQTDATLLYPIKNWKHELTEEDLKIDSPYNTYKIIGLPPTPICNPGLESIQATVNPQKTDYYYYIHDKDGNPHYAKTLEEHNDNINKYLK
ncbi:MAG TPA: endolytic transglycosylase MltG [Candidatus Dojkabacteria bacterium]|nr:endolytic transglycosylase MltG [Candidatus Dojkabacteria bacterium]